LAARIQADGSICTVTFGIGAPYLARLDDDFMIC
jgi:hypothetical protein